MHIVGIRLHNWRCFKGEHELELEPITYSITAEDAGDPDRSNWLGKSEFLRAVVFALTGKHKGSADSWIHGAEREGGVELELDNGVFVSRLRTRGTATHLQVVIPDRQMVGEHLPQDTRITSAGEFELERESAQRWIDEELIDPDTLEKTCYFEQKRTDRFVTMSPTDRSNVVNTWLGLEWIEEAASYCSGKLNAVTAKLEQLDVTLGLLGEDDVEMLEAEVQRLSSVVDETSVVLESQRELSDKLKEWYQAKANSDRRLKLCELRSELVKGEVPAVVTDEILERAASKVSDAQGERGVANQQVREVARLRRGEFDGECPVAGIRCPAAEQINKDTQATRSKYETAKQSLAVIEKRIETYDGHLVKLRRARRTRETWEREIAELESQIVELHKDDEFVRLNPQPPSGSVDDDVRERHEKAVRAHAEKAAELRAALKKREQRTKALEEIEELTPRANAWREAALILGRSGAQRRIAEGSLNQIESLANTAFGNSSIDLSMSVIWAQETGKLADVCDSCGSTFPKSTRVKKCTRCGATRGKKLDQKLRIEMSNSSGGADDLGGAFFQLSAAKWLRKWRGSQWSSFLIDEPFGALDRANTRGLAQHFTRLLSEQFGASQAFVVAHHADILESTPGRIHIKSRDGVSEVKVL